MKYGSSGIWSDGYCEWYIDNLYALCVTICILASVLLIINNIQNCICSIYADIQSYRVITPNVG